MDKFGLNEKTIRIIQELFQTFEQIEKVLIFGSRAKGNYKNPSDIDFAIVGNLNDKELRHLSFCLDELPTPYKFDVLKYKTISNPNLKQSIDDNAKIFYQNPNVTKN